VLARVSYAFGQTTAFSFLGSIETSGVAIGDEPLQCGFTLTPQPSAHSWPDLHGRGEFAGGDASVERCWIDRSCAAKQTAHCGSVEKIEIVGHFAHLAIV
jgi:hypothetical protein